MNKQIERNRFLEFAQQSKTKGTPQRASQNAVIYTRVSSKDQVEGASLDAQLRICEKYAKRKGMHVVECFGGTFESAKTDERKEFNRMLAYVKRNKQVGYVICYNYTRFSRTGLDGAQISDKLKKIGVALMTATLEIDTSTSTGKFQERFQFIMAQWDNEVRTTNMTVGMQQRLLQGYWPLAVPLGYTNLNKGQRADKHQIVVNEDGKLLRKAWQWKIKYGYQNKEIVDRLNKAGLKINERKLSQTFRNPFYCGQIVCSFIAGTVVNGKHEAMVSEKEWVKVIDILTKRYKASKHSQENTEQLPLKRFMVCGDCGQPYTGYLQKQKKIHYYRCRTKGCCKNKSQKKLHVEFESFLTDYEINPGSAGHLTKMMRQVFFQHNQNMQEEAEAFEKNLDKVQQKIEQLEERFVEGEVSKVLFDKYSSKFTKEKEEIQTKIENSSVGSSNLNDCIDWVVSMSQKLSNSWASSDYLDRMRLQNMIFPDGVAYDHENGSFLTKRVNSLFLPIPHLMRIAGGSKNGNSGNLVADPVMLRQQDSNQHSCREGCAAICIGLNGCRSLHP